MSNLLKSNYIVKKEEKRVIDSNNLIASRLQQLNELAVEASSYSREEDPDYGEFKAGLNAEQLGMLLDDNPDRNFFSGGGQDGEDDYPAENYEDQGYAFDEETQEQMQAAAGELLEEARAEAERIVAMANDEAESIRNAARDQGYSEGYEQGNAEALKIVGQKEQEFNNLEEQLRDEYDKRLEEAEPLLVDAITDIFEHIFHVSLSSNREIMLNLLHDTVRNIEGGKNFIIHVSKNDFEYISERKDQLSDGLGSTDTIEVIEDLTLRQTECFIESEGGIYDCGLGTELELLKKELMLLSYQKS